METAPPVRSVGAASVFHYTVGTALAQIAASGHLQPSAVAVKLRERPVLWFSSNPKFEPTAIKMFLWEGSTEPVLPTFAELAEGIGVYRFALPAGDPRLVPWQRLPLVARIAPADVRKMMATGLRVGARPADWSGSLVAIPVGEVTLEVWTGGAWEPASMAAAVAARRTRERTGNQN